jgi:hypothetical protein
VFKKNKSQPPSLDNRISAETGAHDLRFILWREFCSQHKIPVDTMPSQLTGDLKRRWEKLKTERLRRQR